MSAIDNISKRIIEEAEAEAAKLRQEAETQAEDKLQQTNRRCSEEVVKKAEEGNHKIRDWAERQIAVAELDMRKNILYTKQELIDTAFQMALSAFSSMDDAKYRVVIEDMILATTKGSEEVIFCESDKKRLGSDFLVKVNASLQKSGRMGNLTMSLRAADFKGGFVLVSGGVEINSTFDTILRIEREQAESDVAGLLFV